MAWSRTFLCTAALFATAASPPAVREWRPSLAQVEAVEPLVRMPAGAFGPLASYERYYSGEVRHGRRIILGELRHITTRPVSPPVLKIVPRDEMRRFADFGCAVILFEYDVAARRLSPAACGGENPPPPAR
jgi:hypothetical protein